MTALPAAIRRQPDGALTLALHVQPGARRTEVAGLHAGAIKIRLAAPPVEGKANACLLAFVGDCLGVPRRAVSLLAGASARQKVVRVEGADEMALARFVAGLEV